MILATWYKKKLKEALLNEVYSNKSKIIGVDAKDKTIKDKIYQEYLKAYKKGVFNYIKEDLEINGQLMPRKYFSGGLAINVSAAEKEVTRSDPDTQAMIANPVQGEMYAITAAASAT